MRPSYFFFFLFVSPSLPLDHHKCEVAEPLSPLTLRVHYVNNTYHMEKLPRISFCIAARVQDISVFRDAFFFFFLTAPIFNLGYESSARGFA